MICLNVNNLIEDTKILFLLHTKHSNLRTFNSNEVQILTNELNAASGKLNSMTELANQTLKRAKDVYDEALGLYAEVNTTLLPDIKLNKLREDAVEMNRTVSNLSAYPIKVFVLTYQEQCRHLSLSMVAMEKNTSHNVTAKMRLT